MEVHMADESHSTLRSLSSQIVAPRFNTIESSVADCNDRVPSDGALFFIHRSSAAQAAGARSVQLARLWVVDGFWFATAPSNEESLLDVLGPTHECVDQIVGRVIAWSN
jgi:hypothetical protein